MSVEQFWVLAALASVITVLLSVCAWQLWQIQRVQQARLLIEIRGAGDHAGAPLQDAGATVMGDAGDHAGAPCAVSVRDAAGAGAGTGMGDHVGSPRAVSVRDAAGTGTGMGEGAGVGVGVGMGDHVGSPLRVIWPPADRVAIPTPRDDRPSFVDGFDPRTRDWHRRSVLMWVGLFPALMFMLMLLGPAIEDWPVALRTLLVTSVVAPLMVLLILPTLAWVFEDWLVPPLPPRIVPWRLAIITWLAMYPTMTGVLWLFEELIEWLPLGVRAFLVTAIAVPIVRYGLLPRLRTATRGWLVH